MSYTFKRFFLVVFTFYTTSFFGQGKFSFFGNNQEKQEVRFKLVNNLIVFPLEINGKQLSFILDTGVNKTILFSLLKTDSLQVNNADKVILKGLGQGEGIEALVSRNNTFRINNLVSNNQLLYVILGDKFDLSSRMGTTIHGIIGHSLFKDMIVKTDYRSKKLTFYNPEYYNFKPCKKCVTFPLIFHKNKPYIKAKVRTMEEPDKEIDVMLLVDSGGSDALWLFENSKKEIRPPELYFDDILGEGLSGTIYGKRSRIKEFILGPYNIMEPTVSYLDSLASFHARKVTERNGSLGGNILKRFKVWVDYPNKRMVLKKVGSLATGFNYNMSGITVAYSGKTLVKEQVNTTSSSYHGLNRDESVSSNSTFSFVTSYRYFFRPRYVISNVVKGSPADMAGVMVGDIFVTINNKKAYEYDLEDIVNLFQERDGKKIYGKVKRNGQTVKFKFYLKKEI